MYSFYGGRPGNPFVIVTTFRSVEDMVDEFKKGPEYTAVHYDEHVMINTVNKNDPDNGKIYRRGYDFNDETTGGAEYIGTIVGPSGRAPMLELTDLQTAILKSSTEEDFEEKSSEKRIAEGTYNIANGSLVPGKYIVQETDVRGNPKQDDLGNPIYISKYNDEIKWVSCSIRNENNEDCTAYIGFKIPYPVFEISSESVEPYDQNANNVYTDKASISQVNTEDEENHPFYKKWNLKIPKGVKGDSITKLSVQTVTNNSSVETYDGLLDDKNHGYQILTYQQCNYDEEKNPTPKKYFLGDYNMIKNVTNENGTVTISYTHAPSTIINFKSIDDISLDPETGEFTLSFYISSEKLEKVLPFIKNINFDKNTGEIIVNYVNDTTQPLGKLKWIDDIKIENGILKYKYNGDNEEYIDSTGSPVKWVNNVSIADKGKIIFTYSDNTNTTQTLKWPTRIYAQGNQTKVQYVNGDETQLGTIRSLSGVSFNQETGELKVTYTDTGEASLGKISMIAPSNAFQLNNDGKFTVQYAGNSSETEEIGTLRWPISINLNENTADLSVDWNTGDSNIIGKINQILDAGINSEGHLLIQNSDSSKNDSSITFKNIAGWQDLGSVLLSDIEYSGSSVTNLDWTGMGVLRNTGAESQAEKIIKFTIVPTQLLRHTLNNVTINAGTITVVKRGESGAITGFNSADLTQKGANVAKTFAGIDFEIPSGIASDENAAPEFVDIIITGLSLTFS